MKTRAIIFLILLICTTSCFAKVIEIKGDYYVNKPITFKNVSLDVSKGRFIINNNATLSIENSIINSTISPKNPVLISVIKGNIKLNNNQINVKVQGIKPNPMRQSIYYLIKIIQGIATIQKNNIEVDTGFTIGFLTTSGSSKTSKFIISDNTITKFHGGIYLINNHHSVVTHNIFNYVSAANIFNLENSFNTIVRNTMFFPGSLHIGNGVDVFNSENILISDNVMFSNSCYAMFIQGGKNIKVFHNDFYDGITYAVYIFDEALGRTNMTIPTLPLPIQTKFIAKPNSNIQIMYNNTAQNRFAFAGGGVDGLTVANNISINRFKNASARQFWTNTDNLFRNVSNFIWKNNSYKEAYDQEFLEDSKSDRMVTIPFHGGVIE